MNNSKTNTFVTSPFLPKKKKDKIDRRNWNWNFPSIRFLTLNFWFLNWSWFSIPNPNCWESKSEIWTVNTEEPTVWVNSKICPSQESNWTGKDSYCVFPLPLCHVNQPATYSVHCANKSIINIQVCDTLWLLCKYIHVQLLLHWCSLYAE